MKRDGRWGIATMTAASSSANALPGRATARVVKDNPRYPLQPGLALTNNRRLASNSSSPGSPAATRSRTIPVTSATASSTATTTTTTTTTAATSTVAVTGQKGSAKQTPKGASLTATGRPAQTDDAVANSPPDAVANPADVATMPAETAPLTVLSTTVAPNQPSVV